MNFNDYKTLTIGSYQLKKLVRAADGLVLFDKTISIQPFFELQYDGNESSIFIANIYGSYYGGQAVIDWGDGQQTISIPAGGGSVQVRHDNIYGNRTIKFYYPIDTALPTLNSRTMLGIKSLKDYGNNFNFRNTLDSSSAIRPGLFNWTNLQSIDLSKRTSLPTLGSNNYFDSNTSLNTIRIPAALESDFRQSAAWNRYSSKFVVV